LLLLRNGSEISTTAGIAGTGGNGGDISVTVTDGLIVALPDENSDITANAFEGDGGSIQITAGGIVGLQFRPELTPLSDITASSEFGVDGVVQLDTPELDPDQGLVELPSELIDPSGQISTSCLVAADNSLTVSGRSGLPDSPNTSGRSAIWEDWRPLETEVGAAATSTTPINTDLLTEATQVVVAANGHVEFVAPSETLMSPHQMSCGGRS
ncbi:MAG: S-layer family protein, partial [Cyanobacteria bacterium J06636_28]